VVVRRGGEVAGAPPRSRVAGRVGGSRAEGRRGGTAKKEPRKSRRGHAMKKKDTEKGVMRSIGRPKTWLSNKNCTQKSTCFGLLVATVWQN
jgi:hypothetical protein